MTDQRTTPLFHVGAINHHAQKSDLPYVRQTDPLSVPGSSTHTKSSTPDYKIHFHASPEETYHKIAAAIEHHDQLQRHYQLLAKAVQDGVANPEFLTKLVQGDFSPLSGIRAFLNSCLASIPIHMRPTVKSAIKAEKVFNTAELVEAVFCFLPPFDILSAVQVNRTTLHAISTSPALQEIMHPRPSEDGYTSTVFDDPRFTGIQVTIFENFHIRSVENALSIDTDTDDHANGEPGQDVVLHVAFDASVDFNGIQVLPSKVGELCRGILACNLPIKRMRYWPNCCCEGFSSRYKAIVAKDGLTIGKLYDAALVTIKEHRLCSNAKADLHDAEGVVNPKVTFQATFKSKPGDPYFLELVKARSRTEWLEVVEQSGSGQMHAYVKRKQEMQQMGLPIPTLAEFKAEVENGTLERKECRISPGKVTSRRKRRSCWH